MQSRYFKRLLPLTAVALLILAFIARGQDACPGSNLASQTISGERRDQLATTQPEYLSYEEAVERAESLMPKYEDLFWRQPNIHSVHVGDIYLFDEYGNDMLVPDGKGGYRQEVGFNIWVTKKVDQCTLNPEDRIPDTIEGIPVHIGKIIRLEW